MTRRVLVLPSPPTANGDLHLGHLAGPYIAADAFARYRRMRGHDVAYVTGADVHQTYVARMAEESGTTPDATATAFAGQIAETLRLANVGVDAFVLPHRSGRYGRVVGDFYRLLLDTGQVREAEGAVLWCSRCVRYVLGAAVRGTCGNCGHGSDGALCEHCARPVEPQLLRDPRCTRCDTSATIQTIRRLFFSLTCVEGRLRDYHSVARMRSRPREVVASLLADGLFDAAVTSPATWGVPVPAPAFDDQRLDVWAEVGPGYIASSTDMSEERGDPEGWREYWCSDAAEIVQFFGVDNTVPHALLYPALYFAHGDIRPPDRFVINEFHRLDGEKFSTSRRHAIWGSEILGLVPSDIVRYYLCLTASEQSEGNFTLAEFVEVVGRDLVCSIGPFLDELLRTAMLDHPVIGGHTAISSFVRHLEEQAETLGRFFEPDTFSIRAAATLWRDMAMSLGTLLDRVQTGHAASKKADVASDAIVEALSLIASCAHPLMPAFAERLWVSLGAANELATHPWGEPLRLRSRPLAPPSPGAWFEAVSYERLRHLTSNMAAT